MSKPPYRALRIVLGIIALLTAIGGLLLIVSGKPLLIRLFLNPPEAEVSTMLLATVKEIGGMALMLVVFLFLASRDPVRNVAIIHGLIAGLCILAITPLVSLYTTNISQLYPANLIWGRALARLAAAALLFFLRPGDAGQPRSPEPPAVRL
jgi:hypothetical protein